jgi:putative aminopeptidase FrvX
MAHRGPDSTDALLKELLWAYGPCGQEDEVRAVCARELEPVVDDMWTDDAGNLVGYIAADRPPEAAGHRHRSAATAGSSAATRVMGGRSPAEDVYLVFTTNEEIGGVGGSYASASLPGTRTLALEVGPTEQEYGTSVTGGPIIGYGDALCAYDKEVADRLMRIATAGWRPRRPSWARSCPTPRTPRPTG